MAGRHLPEMMGRGDPSDIWRNRPELPNQRLEVRIQLKKKLASVLSSLKSDLQNDGMDVQVDAKFNNAILVSGFLPELGYDKKNVLKKVNTHDAGAYIIPPKETGKKPASKNLL